MRRRLSRSNRARTRWLSLSATLLSLAVLSFAGCADDGADPPTSTVGEEDQTDAGTFTVAEAGIRATLGGDSGMTVIIPVQASAALSGTATITISTLSKEQPVTTSTPFSVGAGEQTVEVDLSAAGLPPRGAEEAAWLLAYTLTSGDSTAKGFKSLFHVLPQFDLRMRLPATMVEGAKSAIRVFALDPLTNEPATSVPVTLRFKNADGSEQTASAQTDENGSAVIEAPEQSAGEVTVTGSAGGGAIALASIETQLDVVRTARVLLTSDKPLYQPGQTMHLRSLALKKPALDAIAGEQATFEVYDGKGNMVFRKYTETNDFGVAATDFKLATQVNTGNYRLQVTVGDTTSVRTVEVKPYRLPKFKVETTLDQTFYLVGETIAGTVNARYFFGKAASSASILIQAGTADVEFFEFAQTSGTTDAEGNFSFEVALPDYLVGSPLENGNALVQLAITVTDAAGQQETRGVSVVVAETPINVIAVPESGKLALGLPNRVLLFATDPIGQPVNADFTVDLLEGASTVTAVESLSMGVGRVELVPDGAVSLEIEAKVGDQASTVTRTLGIGGTDGLLLRTDQALYDAGDTVHVQAFVGAGAGRVFFDVIRDGQTVLTDAADVVDGVAVYDLDLDGSLVGDLQFEAYLVTDQAAIIRDSKLVYVKDASDLAISITADRDEYRPAEEATISFKVVDADNQPTVAAIGVQIVDEAVFELSDNKPGLLETWFRIQEALREPSYQIDGVSFDLTQVVTQATDDAEAQTVATAAFAALPEGGLGELSSWTDVVQKVPAVLAPFYAERSKAIAEAYAAQVGSGLITWENGAERAAKVGPFYDFWGNAYTVEIQEQWREVQAKLTSRGPDELAGTSDDWTGTVLVVENPQRWDEQAAFDGEPNAGGGDGWDGGTGTDGTSGTDGTGGGGEGPRVRKDFPETLYYNPALITDASGVAEVALTLADSITQWRISALANTATGALGSKTAGLTVFQEFFVDVDFPAVLTRGDQVTFPIAVFNYLETEQTVELSVEPGDWFEAAGPTTMTLTVAPQSVTGASLPVTVTKVGTHALTVKGIGSTMSDAVQRLVRVKPDGTETLRSESGTLAESATLDLVWSEALIEGSEQLLVKVYPGIMAQAVEGLDSMLQMPSGCFEQTTATNWPNTLVLDYLRTTGQVMPEIELKALDYLQQGYQRLLTFEVTGGGFVWFGDPAPANVILSAMGVLEFSDMARVIEVDPAVIQRTSDWVVGDQKADGSWHADQGSEFATVQYDDLKTTAFVTWALAESPHGAEAVDKAIAWLTPQVADADNYALAMMANAFAADDPGASHTASALQMLADKAVIDDDGLVHWTFEGQAQYGGWGGGGDGINPTEIEVTALTLQAMLAAGQHLDLVGGGVAWLAGQKDGLGNYGTTHATILSLRAMIRSLVNKTEEGEGTITVTLNDATVATLPISEENRNVFHQFELQDQVDTTAGATLQLSYVGTGSLMYQVVWGGHVPGVPETVGEATLDIDVSWDKTQLQAEDTVVATVTATNLTDAQLDMVMIDLGVPPGFDVLTDSLDAAVASGAIMKYELPGQQVTLYLDKIAPMGVFELPVSLRARYPLEAKAPASSAWLYYDPATRADVEGETLQVQ